MRGEGYVEVNMGYSLAFEKEGATQTDTEERTDFGFSSVPFWDQAQWDKFIWDGAKLSPSELQISGNAESIGFRFQSGETWIAPYVIEAMTYDYTPRRGLRG